MKFVFDGIYTQFMGRTFAFRNPVEVTDKATIEALGKRPDFKRVDPEPVEAAPAPVVQQKRTLTLPFRNRSR